jgi:hypothetical protein
MPSHLFNSESFVALQDPDTGEVSIEFSHARHFSLIRFVLLSGEKNRYADVKYIEGLIDAYYRNPARFCEKRKVMT